MVETLSHLACKLHALPKGGREGGSVSQSRQAAGLSITLGGSSDRKQGRCVNGPAGTVKHDASQVVKPFIWRWSNAEPYCCIWKGLTVPQCHRGGRLLLWRITDDTESWLDLYLGYECAYRFKRQRSSLSGYNGPSKVKFEKTTFHSGSLSRPQEK